MFNPERAIRRHELAIRRLRVLSALKGPERAKATEILRLHPWMIEEYEERIARRGRHAHV